MSTQQVPASVDNGGAVRMYELANEARRDIKHIAVNVKELARFAKNPGLVPASQEDRGETIANIMLAYRHLEDASMRLGKALQALDGGASVYDRATTVGAPP